MRSALGHQELVLAQLAHWYQSWAPPVQWVQWQPQGMRPGFPQLLPPWRVSAHRNKSCHLSSGIRLASTSLWSASGSLKYDAGIHSASSIGYPCQRTKNSRCRRRVFVLHLHRRIRSTSKYWGWSGSSNSTSPGTCYIVLGRHCFSNDT